MKDLIGTVCDKVVIHHQETLPRRTRIFNEGQKFEALYAIRSGCVKKFQNHANGKEEIAGFYFRGDILGLSGIGGNAYMMTAETLDTTSLCEIPFDEMEHCARFNPDVQKKIYELLNEQYRNEKRLLKILRTPQSENRVAAFIVYMSEHFSKRGMSGSRFNLPMNRGDIANYLDLTVETVSRAFSRLASVEILRVQGRDIEIADDSRLHALAGLCFV